MLATAAATPIAPLAARTFTRRADGIDWAGFLARHDMIWDRIPQAWDEAPFLGNGMLGAMLYRDADSGAIRVDIGRSDFQDHRKPMKHANFDNARLPIGHFLLRTRGRVTNDCTLRLNLHDAVLTGEVTTDRGRIGIRAYVHAEDMAIVVETRATGGEAGASWQWVGEPAISPRQTYSIVRNEPTRGLPGYRPNPEGQRSRDGREELWIQPLLAGGGATTAWRTEPGRLVASVAFRRDGDAGRAEALQAVRRFTASPRPFVRHQAWWHAYYPASFISIPDTRVESFYWIQMYKLASATRADRALIDNQGPWLQLTPWPSTWWNLNVQLTYWPTVASNRAELSQSLIRTLHDHRDALIANVAPPFRSDSATINRTSADDLDSPENPPSQRTGATEMTGMASVGRAPEVGDLPWALHNVWMVWRHTQDLTMLRETLFPLLRRTTNYYRHFLSRGADGKLHLPVTYSPEYAAAPDANYDLALLRWSCTALIEAAGRLGIDDPLLPEWKRILAELVDYPRDRTGYMIGAGLPLKSSHRHFSHLLMVYPLYLVNREQPGAVEVIQRTLDHWQSMPEALRGYSSTGASQVSAAIGNGDAALRYLKGLFDDYLRPNTLYKESGPVIETPLSGAQAVMDMLLQSWGGAVRPFPAVPTAWRDCAFSDLSAEGGFLVSGVRAGGATRWIKVVSKAGEPLAIVTDIADPVATVEGRPVRLVPGRNGHLKADLAKGQTLLLRPRSGREMPPVAPVAMAGPQNSFGVNVRNVQPVQKDPSLPPTA
ncbi:hypothetical protein COC42_07915 [Sphingomonas spermidinifaciens]|uniref:Glycosyl hydrolase family 95 catalytic domain-containing protein n=1 Tax=Sphingomonas spermidinifaciens TaxID=1141889 RepID=A0A2A4B8F1_9SPHN|nr:hypothetical protein COC42_07915 [Sphingomonas spermidinifaciens]